MIDRHEAWLAKQRARFLRNNAQLWLRHDRHRFLKPEYPVRKWHLRPEAKANFNSDQPRVPRGNPDGGRWSGDGGTAGGFPSGSGLPVQLAYLRPAVEAARIALLGVEAALSLFTWLSARNSPTGTAILALPSREYKPSAGLSSPLVYAGILTQDELGQACPRNAEVQSLTDRAASSIRRTDYVSAATYGTAVHTKLRDQIRDLNDPNLVAEISVLKTLEETRSGVQRDARYGERGSVRIDVLENAGAGTICVYDIKTGRSGLSVSRINEIARSVYARYPSTQRIIVTETRPRQ